MQPDHQAQFFQRPAPAVDFQPDLADESLQVVCQHLVQKASLVLEIPIDQRLVDPRGAGDFSCGNGVEILLLQQGAKGVFNLDLPGRHLPGRFLHVHVCPALEVNDKNKVKLTYMLSAKFYPNHQVCQEGS
jgi:hypothetical protein